MPALTTGDWGKDHSPFPAGEVALQTKVGKQTQMEQFGRRILRPYLPSQHREFYANLPYILVGSIDA